MVSLLRSVTLEREDWAEMLLREELLDRRGLFTTLDTSTGSSPLLSCSSNSSSLPVRIFPFFPFDDLSKSQSSTRD